MRLCIPETVRSLWNQHAAKHRVRLSAAFNRHASGKLEFVAAWPEPSKSPSSQQLHAQRSGDGGPLVRARHRARRLFALHVPDKAPGTPTDKSTIALL
jgi:hypothetical protein